MILLRYFFREVLLSTGAVSLVLLFMMLSNRFIKYLAKAAQGDLDTGLVFWMILYRIPDFLQLILPLGLFVALLLTYGRLYLDNEMRVMFAAGLSRFQLLLLTLAPVVFVAVLAALVSFWISPGALARVDSLLEAQGSRSELDALQQGRFQSFRQDHGVIFAEEITDQPADSSAANANLATGDTKKSGLKMRDVYVFQQEILHQDGIPYVNEIVMVAKNGSEEGDARGRYLVLDQGYRLRELKTEHAVERVDFARYGQRIEMRGKLELQDSKVDAIPSDILASSSLPEYQAAWQWRISLVLLVPVLALIAIALGKTDARQGRYLKIFPAILIYLVYLVVLNVARDKLGHGEWPAALGMWWIHLLFLLLGVLLFNMESIMRRYLRRTAKSPVKPGVIA